MNAARTLRKARRRAGLTQRALARATGVAQATVARIETGREVPRVDTLDALLEACGERLLTLPRGGEGVDRSQIRELLALTPAQRLRRAAEDAAGLERLLAARPARIG